MYGTCACAGDRLIYNYNAVGGTATQWKGTAFDCTCPLDDSEITLRHSQFASSQDVGINFVYNNGDLVGHSIGVANDCYTSQLNVTIRKSFNNKTVQCAFTSSAGTRIIGESVYITRCIRYCLPGIGVCYTHDCVQVYDIVVYYVMCIYMR